MKATEAANKAKTIFLSNMSHEIRTPINAILGMNEGILRECEDEGILSYAENVKAAGSTLLGLVNDVLDFSKIEAGKIEILPVDYDLSSVLNDLVNIIQARSAEKGLDLVLDFDKSMPKMLRGDEVRIKQVVTNILTNAVKYTEKGTVTFSVGFDRDKSDPDGVILHVETLCFVEPLGIDVESAFEPVFVEDPYEPLVLGDSVVVAEGHRFHLSVKHCLPPRVF